MDITRKHDIDTIDNQRDDLTALVASRICHDLISPLGAISNGVELLMMSSLTSGPEMALIAQSVAGANARICFFRVAFGAHSSNQQIGRAEVVGILDDTTRGGRLSIAWKSPPEASRGTVKMAFLALLCLETAMPYGGRVEVSSSGDAWTLVAEADKLKIDPLLWDRVSGAKVTGSPAAAQVQFALLPDEARHQGRTLHLTLTATRIVLIF